MMHDSDTLNILLDRVEALVSRNVELQVRSDRNADAALDAGCDVVRLREENERLRNQLNLLQGDGGPGRVQSMRDLIARRLLGSASGPLAVHSLPRRGTKPRPFARAVIPTLIGGWLPAE